MSDGFDQRVNGNIKVLKVLSLYAPLLFFSHFNSGACLYAPDDVVPFLFFSEVAFLGFRFSVNPKCE